MREALKTFRDAATGRWAVSLPAYLLTIPFGALVGYEREDFFNPNLSNPDKVLIVAAGYFTAFIYIFTAQYLLLRDRKIRKQPLWRCVFVWTSTGAIWGLGSTYYARYIYGDVIPLVDRLRQPIIYSGATLALMAFYFGVIDKRRIEAHARRNLLSILSTDRDELHRRESNLKNEARSVLESNIGKQLMVLQDLLKLPSTESKSLAFSLERLQELSIELSEALSQEISSLSKRIKSGSVATSERSDDIPLWSGLFPRVLSVRISLLLIGLGAFLGQFPRNGVEGVFAGWLGVVPIGTALYALSRFAKGRSFATFPLFIPFSYMTVFLVQVLWTSLQSTVGLTLTDPYNPIYAGLKTAYGIFLASLISELITSTTRELEDTRILNSALIEQISELSINKKYLNKTLLEVRYGEIQGKISGVIMAVKLLQTDSSSIEDHPQLLVDARQLLGEALDGILELANPYED